MRMVGKTSLLQARRVKEAYVYGAFLLLMALATSGLPFVRYAFYALPFLAVLIWLASGRPEFNISRPVAPFVFLLVLSLISLTAWDFNSFKKTYFIFVFASVFVLLDFSRIGIDYRKLACFFVALAAYRLAVYGPIHGPVGFSVLDSAAALESTFAFPLGVIALHFVMTRRFLWAVVCTVAVLIFLKRIVLIALAVCIVVWLLPKRFQNFILTPWVLTFAGVLVTVLSIKFAYGAFDEQIVDLIGRSPNDLSKGRQALWFSALDAANFSYDRFLLLGVGVGKVVSGLQDALRVDRILLHNDLLSLVLETGFVPFAIFMFLLTSAKERQQRLMSLFLMLLFTTDNILIYQHVMFVYLMVQQYWGTQNRVVSRRRSDRPQEGASASQPVLRP
jgi:hypothetical protein